MPSDWDRVASDPELLAAVRRAYAGSGDVLDQLWWLEHPGEPAPSGAEDPAARVEAARRAAYRPGGSADAAAAAQAELDADRVAAVEALRHAEAHRSRPVEARSSAPAPLRLVVGAAVAVLVLGAAIGFGTARFVGTGRPAALAVFDRAQTAADRPPASAPLPSWATRSTLRFIGTSTSSGAVLYADRRPDGRVCLIVVVLALDDIGTCTTEAAFRASGLTLTFRTAVDPETDSPVLRLREISPTWAPDGSVRF